MSVSHLDDLAPYANASFATNRNGAYQGPRFDEGATWQDVVAYQETHSFDEPFTTVGQSLSLSLIFPGYKDAEKPKLLKTVVSYVETPDGGEAILSGQFGCTYECVTCESADAKGFNQSPEQLFYQAYVALNRATPKVDPYAPLRILMTGEGDDGVNAENIINAIPKVKEAFPGLNFVRVSTVGAIAGISKFAQASFPEDVEVELQISLHATDDEFRSEFAPRPRNMKIANLLEAGEKYYALTGQKVRLNYLTFERNMREEDVAFLAALDQEIFYVALVPPNKTTRAVPDWARIPVSAEQVEAFHHRIERLNPALGVVHETDYAATILETGCGQVAGNQEKIIPLRSLATGANFLPA